MTDQPKDHIPHAVLPSATPSARVGRAAQRPSAAFVSFRMRMSHGRLLLDEGNATGALEEFDGALDASENETENLAALLGKTNALTHLGRTDEIREQFAIVERLPLSEPVPVRELARVAMTLGMPDTALKFLETLCGTGHDACETRVLCFEAHAALGDLASARASLDRAVELDPADAHARKERARLHWAQGREAEALVDCESALAAMPEDADLLWAYGHLLKRAGRHEAAAAAYERFRAALGAGAPR